MKLSELKYLYDAGMALHWLHPRDKRPIENNWTKGPRKTWAELKATFRNDQNVGVVLGPKSKMADGGYLCCIDVDVKKPEFKEAAYTKLKEILDHDASRYSTVLSGSGSGSCHLYCMSNEPFKMVEVEKRKGEWEICAYSEGRQMVLPPSLHPNGKPYIWQSPMRSRLPLFDPRKVQIQREIRNSEQGVDNGTGKAVKFETLDLWATNLPVHIIHMIEDGRGCDDRSAALMTVAMMMCRKGHSDAQILSVLTQPNYFLSECAYEHANTRDRFRAAEWVRRYTLEKARYETSVMRYFDHPPASMAPLPPEEVKEVANGLKAEKAILMPDVNGEGLPKRTLKNILHILGNRLGDGPVVGFNEFSNRYHFLKDTPYGGAKGQELADHHDLALKIHIAEHFRFEPSKELCFEAHTAIGRKHAWHPVRDYLKGLEWDGQSRLDSWLRRAFGASGPGDYLGAVGRKVLVAAVKRVMEPGCKFDYMMVLEGEQGIKKSMSLDVLASTPWFTDNLGDIHSKDVVDQMNGKWLIEIAELASIRGYQSEQVKSFLTRKVDRVRMSYGRRSEDYPRQSIFIGSTNNHEYLTDETGNRRYWPVKVSTCNAKWLTDNRDQLWAEATSLYDFGEDVWLTKELESVAKEEQEKRFEVDEWELQLKITLKDETSGSRHQANDLWRSLHDLNNLKEQAPMRDLQRIGRILARIGYEKRKIMIDGVQGKWWVKK